MDGDETIVGKINEEFSDAFTDKIFAASVIPPDIIKFGGINADAGLIVVSVKENTRDTPASSRGKGEDNLIIRTWKLQNDGDIKNITVTDRGPKTGTLFNKTSFTTIDAMCVIPEKQRVLIFSNDKVVTWDLNGQDKDLGTPTKISEHEMFKQGSMPFVRITAAFSFDYEDAPDYLKNRSVFFSGSKYVVWNLETMKNEGDPRAIEDGFQVGNTKCNFDAVDAAFILPTTKGLRGYLFYEEKFFKFLPPVKIPLNDIRFNKCPPLENEDFADPKYYDVNLYTKGVLKDKDFYPLKAADYPLKSDNAQKLKKRTTADSVVTDGDVQLDLFVKGIGKLEKLEAALTEPSEGEEVVNKFYKITPIFPGGEGFWSQLKTVVDFQNKRLALADAKETGLALADGKNGKRIYWPEIWYDRKNSTQSNLNPFPKPTNVSGKTLTLEDVAQSVKGDYSNYHQQTLIKEILKEEKPKLNELLPEERSKKDFIGVELRMATLNAWTLEAVGPLNFRLKWFHGMPRPEEVMWLVYKDDITYENEEDKPPEELKDNIRKIAKKKMQTLDPEKDETLTATHFTAYKDGSPTHPSFPAMHSAGSTLSLWLPVVYDISDDDYLEALKMDYAVAFARTVAGVHYPQDNIAGLNAGQQIIAERLPKFLAANYGYDEGKVKSKIEKLTFDWDKVKFESRTECTIGSDTHKTKLKKSKSLKRKRDN